MIVYYAVVANKDKRIGTRGSFLAACVPSFFVYGIPTEACLVMHGAITTPIMPRCVLLRLFAFRHILLFSRNTPLPPTNAETVRDRFVLFRDLPRDHSCYVHLEIPARKHGSVGPTKNDEHKRGVERTNERTKSILPCFRLAGCNPLPRNERIPALTNQRKGGIAVHLKNRVCVHARYDAMRVCL
mmetsp:Transcript_101917/g.207109  ORF Transcript_101917/g.207109 Transcript_101917/m.207109 type:complete len:185 (-) Transcript_101917:1102-1656(-)